MRKIPPRRSSRFPTTTTTALKPACGSRLRRPRGRGAWRIQCRRKIYDIPPSSPLYYVTYVKVYGSTPEVVYVGYTPGYYGTVVSASTTTVVYGTGWYYPPYISPTVWYGWPYTYGVGAGFTYTTDSGWSFGFGYGYGYYPWYYPWWGPMGYYGYGWYPYYGWGAWGGAAVANVYGVWGNTAYSRTGAAWANPYTGNYGAATRGAYHNTQTGRTTVAGRGTNTNIYTGNTAGYRGGATYNPNTGIVAGGGAGYAGNIYSGQGTAGTRRVRLQHQHRTREWQRVRTTSTPAKMARSTIQQEQRQLVVQQRQRMAVDDQA